MKKFIKTHKFVFSFLCIIAFIVIFTAVCIHGSSDSGNYGTKVLSTEQWNEDIDSLESIMSQSHPFDYDKISQKDFQSRLEALKKEVPKLSDSDINLKLIQIMASLGQGHDNMDYDLGSGKTYPLYLSWFGNDYRVVKTLKGYENILGTKLVSINGMPLNKVMEKINTFIPQETDQLVKTTEINFIVYPEVLNFLKITESDAAVWEFEDDNNQIIKVTMKPEDHMNLDGEGAVDIAKPDKLLTNPDPSDSLDVYWYKYIPENKTMYFQYNECIDRDIAKANGFGDFSKYPVFRDFVNKLLKAIDTDDVEKLVIDLRNNGGGNEGLIKPFILNIQNNKKLNQRGRIFVITGAKTFSAAVINTIDFENDTNAIIIGQPTGGSVKFSAGDIWNSLPNSRIRFCYSTELYPVSFKYKDSIIPDIIVNESFKDYKNGIDDVYRAIQSYK